MNNQNNPGTAQALNWNEDYQKIVLSFAPCHQFHLHRSAERYTQCGYEFKSWRVRSYLSWIKCWYDSEQFWKREFVSSDGQYFDFLLSSLHNLLERYGQGIKARNFKTLSLAHSYGWNHHIHFSKNLVPKRNLRMNRIAIWMLYFVRSTINFTIQVFMTNHLIPETLLLADGSEQQDTGHGVNIPAKKRQCLHSQ